MTSLLPRSTSIGKTLALLLLTTAGVGCDSDPTEPELSGPSGAGDFFVENGSITIATTLYLPSSGSRHPIVILVPGSANDTRESERPFADLLTPLGYGVFTYDKRGVGESSGSIVVPTTEAGGIQFLEDRASDVLALVEFLATHEDVDPQQIGLFGSSQGGWVVPQVAAQSEDVAFIISGSGAASPTGLENYYDALADDSTLSIADLNLLLTDYDGPTGFDPRPYLEAVDVPGLWIYGGMDRSNPTDHDINILEEIIEDHGKDFTILLFPFANHDLEDVRTGEIPEDLLPKVLDWLGAL